MRSKSLTLSTIARLLKVEEHRLIYLCDQGQISPDIEDARGRGKSRQFSRRNLLEFAVALRLREAMASVATVRAVIRVLRSFERLVRTKIPGFRLPEGLEGTGAPDLRVIISDARFLYFSLGPGKSRPRLFGGIDIEHGPPQRAVLRPVKAIKGPAFGAPEGSKHSRLELSITEVARSLPSVDGV